MSAIFALDVDLDQDPSAEPKPKYEVLKDHFVKAIKSGQLKSGTALPTELRMCESLGIGRSTVRQAMQVLEQEGLIRRVQGKGTFVHDEARVRLKEGMQLFALIVPET